MSTNNQLPIPRVRQPFGYLATTHEAEVSFAAALNAVIPFTNNSLQSEEKYITANESGGSVTSFTLKVGHVYKCTSSVFLSTATGSPSDPITRSFSWYDKDISTDATTGILGIAGVEQKSDTTRDFHNSDAVAYVDTFSLDKDITVELKVKTVTDASTVVMLDVGTTVIIELVPNFSGPWNENKS